VRQIVESQTGTVMHNVFCARARCPLVLGSGPFIQTLRMTFKLGGMVRVLDGMVSRSDVAG
jgi:hypothetical protein